VSCDVFERHFLGLADAAKFDAHRESCPLCARDSMGLIGWARSVSPLAMPAVPPSALARWATIPSLSLDCERLAEALARRLDGPLPADETGRVEFHLSRCEGCREAAAVLAEMQELQLPAAPRRVVRRPVGVVSLAAARRHRARSRAFDPRLYAAAACLVAGLATFLAGPTGLAGSTGAARSATENFASAVRVKGAEAGEWLGHRQEKLSRGIYIVRESVVGYGKAAGSIALSAAGRAAEEIFLKSGTKTEKGKKS
jgi:hypothetical protein